MQVGALSPALSLLRFSSFWAELCLGSHGWTVQTCRVGKQNPICIWCARLPPTCTCELPEQEWLAEPLWDLCSLAGRVLSQLAVEAGEMVGVMKCSPQGHLWISHLLQFSFYGGHLKGAALLLQSDRISLVRSLHYLSGRWCAEGCCVVQQQMGVLALLDWLCGGFLTQSECVWCAHSSVVPYNLSSCVVVSELVSDACYWASISVSFKTSIATTFFCLGSVHFSWTGLDPLLNFKVISLFSQGS